MSAKDMASGQQATGGIADRVNRLFRRLLVITTALTLMLVALFIYILVVVRPAQNRYDDGARALQLAHAAMIDQETGLRGFLLVDEDAFLQPYRQGVATVGREDEVLNRTLGSDQTTAPALLDMRVAQQRWSSEWAVVVACGGAPSSHAALVDFLNKGKSLFDVYRAKELALSDEVQSRRDLLEARRGIALLAGLAATVVFVSLLFVEMVRKRRRLRAAVVQPVDDIIAATAAIAAGDFSSSVVIQGASEFELIGASIDRSVAQHPVDVARDHRQPQPALRAAYCCPVRRHGQRVCPSAGVAQRSQQRRRPQPRL